MLCAIGASFVFQVLTRPMVGYNWVVSGMAVVVLDSVMDSVLDPISPGLPARALLSKPPGLPAWGPLRIPAPATNRILARGSLPPALSPPPMRFTFSGVTG